MNRLERAAADLFPARGRPRSRQVGVEQELLAFDAWNGGAVDIARVRRALAGTPLAGAVAFEPGGQVELNLPCAPGPRELGVALAAALSMLRERCGAAGVRLEATPVDPRPLDQLPLQLRTPRYLGMQDHFDRIGSAGRRMMRQTASTQLCLDWWPGAAGLEQWRLAQLAGPYLAAALSRSDGPTSRLSTWLAADPGRTAFDDRLLRGEDPVRAYADFARTAAVIVVPDHPDPVAHHLSTLFPPVRPRGRYLEVRYLDAQPDHLVAPVAAAFAGLLHDDDVRRRALRSLAGEESRLAERWHTAALTPQALADRGNALLSLAGTQHLEAAGAA